jgi:hypothetical protein
MRVLMRFLPPGGRMVSNVRAAAALAAIRLIPASSIHDFTQRHVDTLITGVQSVNDQFHRHRFQPLISLVKQAAQWICKTFIAIGPKHLQSYLCNVVSDC